jgi:hypothetical protein
MLTNPKARRFDAAPDTKPHQAGHLVYEPFLGSGTTLAAAELTERVCMGIELDPKYLDVIVQTRGSLDVLH